MERGGGQGAVKQARHQICISCNILCKPPPRSHPLACLHACEQRPRDIVIKAQNEKGEALTMQLGGTSAAAAWISRIFQHEYDHLQVC